MKRNTWLLFAFTLLFCIPGSAERVAGADKPDVMRVAMLVPRSAMAAREAKKWNNRIMEATGGRLSIRVYWGGSSGDEKAVLRKMRMGQIDASGLTTTSLSDHVKQVQILNAPGLFQNYKQLDAVVDELSPRFNKEAYDNGFKVLGWGDIGRIRLFSRQPIRRVADLKRMRPWLWTSSLMMKEFYRIVGATGVPMEIPEVYGGLQTGMVDVVLSSAIASLAALWFTKTPYVSRRGSGYISGAFVVSRKKFDSWPKEVGEAMVEMSEKYHGRVIRNLRRADAKSFNRLLKRGLTAIPVENEKEWNAVQHKITERFVGRLYSRDLLNQARAICARHK